MAGASKIDNIVATGSKGTVEYAILDNGTSEARDWLRNQTDAIKARFGVLFERLVEFGTINNDQQFRKLHGFEDVWEFKRNEHRLFCVQQGRRWLLTHYYQKGHSKQHQSSSAARAETIAREHLARERREIQAKKKGNK